MTHQQALKMRLAVDAIFRLTDRERYCCAIEERLSLTSNTPADYALHLYTRDSKKSGLVSLTLLANAIESLGTAYLAVESTYDAGTQKGEDIRNSVKIW